MKKYLLLNILMLLFIASNSQYVVSLSSNFDNDTLNICDGDEISFYAYGILDGDTLDNLNYKWDFDDGYFENGTDLDTMLREFPVPRAYRVMVTVWNDNYWGYDILPIRVGLKPWFTDTKVDLPDDQIGICNGEVVSLIGDIKIKKWTEERNYVRTEIFPQYLDLPHPYSSYITRRSFDIGATFSSATDIDSIGVKIEHSNTANVRIMLTCPTGQTVMLKDSGGVEKAFGEPIIASGDFSEGVGYWYYFTNFPTHGTMNTFSDNVDTLPSGTYQSDSLFTKLNGCPLNGDWTISVEDLVDDEHDGYLFSWALYFNEDIEGDTIIYNNSYDITNSIWNGDGINLTEEGIGNAKPEGYDGHEYSFLIKDDYGCYHDTSLTVIVEKATFLADKETMEIGDSVHVEDSTSWATAWEWDFGDLSDIETAEDYYKKYQDSGYYDIMLTAYSESGCYDYDTTQIRIVPRSPLVIADYNIFTPNGDGVNDVFTFFNTDDEKITAANIETVHGGIYNRYGELVCRWNDPQKILDGWDGTKNNGGVRPLPSGYYYYTIVIKGKDGIKYYGEEFSGIIYLYRAGE